MRTFWILLTLATIASAVWWMKTPDEPPLVSSDTEPPVASSIEEILEGGEAEVTSADTKVMVSTAMTDTEAASPPTDAVVEAAVVTAEPSQVTATVEEPPAGEATLPLGLDRTIPDATVVKGHIVRSEAGLLLADDRFEIEGSGTEEDPYRISWELLISAGEGYRPRVGDRSLPQRVALLDGAWVAIEGYVAFPMLVGSASEALVMLNRWDGCCIGVPPSPYDAVEVRLDKPVVRTTMHAIDYGTVTGKFSVSPYLVQDWLVGLYLMDQASLKLDL